MSQLRNAVSRRRGMVLIIVLSVLAVMAILGISLVTLNAIEKSVTSNHLNQVQARLSARSGVEDAMARLRDGAVLRSAFDAEGEWLYKGNDAAGQDPAKRMEPLSWALLPSFPKKGVNGQPETMDVWREDIKATVKVGVSGTSAGVHSRSNVYSLEVRDLSSCVYLNDGVHLYGANNSSVSQNLGRILNRLGEHSKVAIGQLGNLVLRLRPSTGFASWQDFATVMKTKGGLTELQLQRLQRYVTTVAWIDKNVVNPAPLSQAVVSHYPVRYERGEGDAYMYRRGPGRDHRNDDRSKDERLAWLPDFAGITGQGGVSSKVYAMDELYPTYVEVTHRAPVNVNTAEEPVLIALLADLKGFFLLEKRTGVPFSGDLPSSFNYTAMWAPNPLIVGGRMGEPVSVSFSAPRGWGTFENMGHTYSRNAWKAKTEVNEKIDYRALYGGTTQSTQSSIGYEMVEDHDSMGELWITQTLSGGDGSGTVAGGVSAKSIAQEILACRGRTGRYANSPFGGPFKNWAQFYAFCDNLVNVRKDGSPGIGLLRDDRLTREPERRQAEQAMADMLKANFNPNFTPNETNPDHNLFLMVDKTDLVVNSTEFCFLPTGLFSIHSIGRVLRDRRSETDVNKNGKDSGNGTQEIVAQSRIDSIVRAYEVYRETSQRHFYLGEATPAEDASYTNNGLTVESGPEPDNGPLLYNEHLGHEVKFQRLNNEVDGYAGDSRIEEEVMSGWGYEASGTLQLPTRGGIGSIKRRGEIVKPDLAGSPLTQWDTNSGLASAPTMRASFRLNDSLDYSVPGATAKEYLLNAATNVLTGGNTGSQLATISEYVYNPATCSGQVITRVAGGSMGKPRIEQASNFPDPGEEGVEGDGGVRLSPYDATDGSRYRLVRSYRLPLSSIPGSVGAGKTVAAPMGGTESLPRMMKSAPSDLRVDGYYSERHSGLAYWIEEPMTGSGSFNTYSGTASFWFKPGFDPANSGKVRSIASVSKYHRKNFYYRNPSPFTLFFVPAFAGGAGDTREVTGGAFAPPTTMTSNKVPTWSWADYTRLTAVPRASMVFQVAYSTFDGMGWGMEYEWQPGAGQTEANSPMTPGKYNEVESYWVTDNLNKAALGKVENDMDGLRAHRWTHITMTWKLGDLASVTSEPQNRVKVLVNGRDFNVDPSDITAGWQGRHSGVANATGSAPEAAADRRARISDQDFIDHNVGPDGAFLDERWHFPGDRWEEPTERYIVNTFRLGEVSTHSFMPETFSRNFSSDGTYDEFYFWVNTNPDNMGGSGLTASAQPGNLAAKKFMQGRYHVPGASDEDALWTSPELSLKSPIMTRELASPTRSVATGGGKSSTGGGVGMTTTGGAAASVKLLGVSWTWYAEKYGNEVTGNTLGGQASLVPIMVDYQGAGPADMRQEKSCARIFVKVDDLRYPLNDPTGFSNDSFSAIQDQAGQPVSLGDGAKFRYQVKFKVEGSDASTVLLATPVLDDVTFFYLTPGSSFLQYVERTEIE